MASAYKVVAVTGSEPLTLQDVADYVRIDYHDEDVLLTRLVRSARSLAETVTHRALVVQQIQQIYTIERPIGGELSGPINRGPNWYQYQEQLGANPFGAAQFYFDLALPPIQTSVALVAETKVVAFDTWKVFPQVTNPDGSTNTWIDDVQEPARLYFMSPITANFWRFTYTTGYDGVTKVMPNDLRQTLLEAVAYWFDHREGDPLPEGIMCKLLSHRVDWV